MSRTTSSRPKVSFSAIQYRPDAGRAIAKPIELGLLMEFAVGNVWTVGLVLRHAVPPALLEGLSPLSRELIEGAQI